MGDVYLAFDRHLGKQVALKLLRAECLSSADLERFRREFAMLAQLEHPGIARAYDFGEIDGRPCFTSEFIRGEVLSAAPAADAGPAALALAVDLAEALAFLHGGGIVHLDVKPANVILRDESDGPRAVLIDFGLCRSGGAAPPGDALRGSLPYMGPEYFRRKPLGPWTDVYAFGVTLYRQVTGRFPRQGAASGAHGAALDPRAWPPLPAPAPPPQPAVDADLERILLKCLALEPESRYPSGAAVLAALRRIDGKAPRPHAGGLRLSTFGRERELDAAGRFLDGALRPADRSGSAKRVLAVTAAPGHGQTQFLRELKIRAQTRGLKCYLESGFAGRAGAAGQLLRCLGAHLDVEARSRWQGFLDALARPRRASRNEILAGERRLRRAHELSLALAGLREPLVLAIDGLQHFDEVSIELVIELVRLAASPEAASKPILALVIGYREENAFNEFAYLKTCTGDLEGARSLCDLGLAAAARERSLAIRESVLNLRATRAQAAMREFRFDAAIGEFQRALELAEAIASPANQAVILNNLGIAHLSCDRYGEAVRAFEEAERLGRRLDEGPSLVSIYGNLAVLHAKRGDFEAMETALAQSARLRPAAIGRRQDLFVKHASGLCRLYQGRFADAVPLLDAAAARAEASGDALMAGFDRAYGAEAKVFLAAYAEAARELRRLIESPPAPGIRRMAAARLALAAALCGDWRGLDQALADAESAADERPVPFLQAWDRLFLGWAASIASADRASKPRAEGEGRRRRAIEALASARDFFEARGLAPAAAMASWVEAEGLFLRGALAEALEVLAAGPPPAHAFLAALRPLLEARGAKAEREPPPTRALDVAAPAAAGFVARSRAARRLVDAIARAAESDQAVLILGEPGAGKERAARAIHAASRRRGGPFLVLDCATVPEALLEVELFGARAGAFTDCVEDRAGILAGAEGGTVLIDEVAAAPAAVQAKLLRVLSSGRCRRVGDECETALDVRFLASCRGGLEEEVEAGRFREDLYFRLRGSAVEVPPLRDRPEDLEPLLDTFLREGGGSPPSLARGALERLRELPWPGNVRELKNLAARMRLDGVRVITAEILERLLAQPKTETLFPRSLLARSDWPALRDRLERDYIVHHLRRLRGDTRALAEFLGIRRQQLYRKCGRLGVRVAELRSKEGSAGG